MLQRSTSDAGQARGSSPDVSCSVGAQTVSDDVELSGLLFEGALEHVCYIQT